MCESIRNLAPLSAATGLRLVLSPLVAAALALCFQFSNETAQVLIAVAGMPMSVNIYILCAEYRHEESIASQGVFWTTLLSAFTLAVLLALFH